MGRESWLGLGGRLKKAVKKLTFVLSFKLRRWHWASIVGCAFTRRRLSFDDRVGLHGCIEDDQGEKSDGNCSFRGVQRAKSFAYSDDDVDRRADIFIANFRRQLRLERQISLELRSRRSWKPNVQEKRLFSYILDRHIRVKVTTHALRCIDKAGGIDEYLLKTPYHKMDTEMGLYWKAKIEKLYEELGKMEVVFFSPEDEEKFEQGFKDLKLSERVARREARRQMYGLSDKHREIEGGQVEGQVTDEDAARTGDGSSHHDFPEQLVANT